MELHVSEPWFTHIMNGKKVVEGRLCKGRFMKIVEGDILVFFNEDKKISVKVTKTCKYNTFAEYLNKEGIERCLPGVDSIEEGCNIYYKYYNKEQEAENKILAIVVQKVL